MASWTTTHPRAPSTLNLGVKGAKKKLTLVLQGVEGYRWCMTATCAVPSRSCKRCGLVFVIVLPPHADHCHCLSTALSVVLPQRVFLGASSFTIVCCDMLCIQQSTLNRRSIDATIDAQSTLRFHCIFALSVTNRYLLSS